MTVGRRRDTWVVVGLAAIVLIKTVVALAAPGVCWCWKALAAHVGDRPSQLLGQSERFDLRAQGARFGIETPGVATASS